MTPLALRQIVWNAVLAELDGVLPDAHDRATRIADSFHRQRALGVTRRVTEATRTAIKSDLTVGYYSYAQIRQRHGVGISTIQSIARELRAKGVTVHTVGARNNGRTFPRG